jgi:hypothetical protein
MADIIAERALEHDGQPDRPVTVRIYRPEQRPAGEWECRFEVLGLQPLSYAAVGEDSVQALFGALRLAGMELERYKGRISWLGHKPWEPAGFHDLADMKL